jgi:hypothetical protein
LALFIFTYRLCEREKELTWVKTIVFITVLEVFVIFGYVYFTYGSVRFMPREAVGWNFGSFSNVGAAQIIGMLPFVLYYATTENKKWMLVLVMALFIILVSQSRGAYVLSGVTVLVFLWFFSLSKTNIRNVFYLLFSTFFILFFIISIIPTEMLSFVFERLLDSSLFQSAVVEGDTDFSRHQMYNALLDILFSNNIVLGIGYEAFPFYIEEKYGKYMTSHSLLVTMLGELGLLGAVVLFWLVILIMQSILIVLKNRGTFDYFLPVVISVGTMFIQAFFRPQLQNPAFWFSLALLFSAANVLRTRHYRGK